jgi:hypothetical protein
VTAAADAWLQSGPVNALRSHDAAPAVPPRVTPSRSCAVVSAGTTYTDSQVLADVAMRLVVAGGGVEGGARVAQPLGPALGRDEQRRLGQRLDVDAQHLAEQAQLALAGALRVAAAATVAGADQSLPSGPKARWPLWLLYGWAMVKTRAVAT